MIIDVEVKGNLNVCVLPGGTPHTFYLVSWLGCWALHLEGGLPLSLSSSSTSACPLDLMLEGHGLPLDAFLPLAQTWQSISDRLSDATKSLTVFPGESQAMYQVALEFESLLWVAEVLLVLHEIQFLLQLSGWELGHRAHKVEVVKD